MSLSSAGISSPALSSASLRITASIGHWLKSRRRNSKNLGSVIKALKVALKQYESSLNAQKRAAEVIKNWGDLLPDEASRQLIDKLYTSSSIIWCVDPSTTVKIRTILAKLESLRDEEETRDQVMKDLEHAEHTYYKALYKGYPENEVEGLLLACRELKIKSQAANMNYRNSMVLTLSQCLESLFENLSVTSQTTISYSNAVLSMLSSFDTSAKDEFPDSDSDLISTSDSSDDKNGVAEYEDQRLKAYCTPAGYDVAVNDDNNKENMLGLGPQIEFSTRQGYSQFGNQQPLGDPAETHARESTTLITEETTYSGHIQSGTMPETAGSSLEEFFPQQSVKPLRLRKVPQQSSSPLAYGEGYEQNSEYSF